MTMIVKVRDEDPRDEIICGSCFEMNFAVEAESIEAAKAAVKDLPRYKQVFANAYCPVVVRVTDTEGNTL